MIGLESARAWRLLNKEEEEGVGGWGGSGVPGNEGEESEEGGGGCGGDTAFPGADSEEEEKERDGGEGEFQQEPNEWGGVEKGEGIGSASVTCACNTSSCIFWIQ